VAPIDTNAPRAEELDAYILGLPATNVILTGLRHSHNSFDQTVEG
jgi:hypothetical protein